MRMFGMLFNAWFAKVLFGFFEIILIAAYFGIAPASAQEEVDSGEAVGAYNIALLDLGAVAEANGQLDEAKPGKFGASSAIDGERSSFWAGIENRAPLVMVIKFSMIHEINRIRIVEDYNGSIFFSADFEYFDGENWVPLFSETKNQPGMDRSFESVHASKVRMTIHSWNGEGSLLKQSICINAFEVYAAPEKDEEIPDQPGQPVRDDAVPGKPGTPVLNMLGNTEELT